MTKEHPKNRSDFEKALDLQTNLENRAAVLTLLAVGYTRTQVATIFGRTPTWVRNVSRNPRPGINRLTHAIINETWRSCQQCNERFKTRSNTAYLQKTNTTIDPNKSLCPACIKKNSDRLRETIKLHCYMVGYIPSARTLAKTFSIGKSSASKYLIELFGHDPLDGGERLKQGPRRLPTETKQETVNNVA